MENDKFQELVLDHWLDLLKTIQKLSRTSKKSINAWKKSNHQLSALKTIMATNFKPFLMPGKLKLM